MNPDKFSILLKDINILISPDESLKEMNKSNLS